jgi:hypothetical protein
MEPVCSAFTAHTYNYRHGRTPPQVLGAAVKVKTCMPSSAPSRPIVISPARASKPPLEPSRSTPEISHRYLSSVVASTVRQPRPHPPIPPRVAAARSSSDLLEGRWGSQFRNIGRPNGVAEVWLLPLGRIELAAGDPRGRWSPVVAALRACPRQDSNLSTRLRRPVLYPLSYEGGPRDPEA